MVVAQRTARMMAAGMMPSERDRKEFQDMGTEKVQVFWQSMNAMGMQVVKAQQEYALLAMSQWMSAWVVPLTVAGMHSNSNAQHKQLRRSMEKVIEHGMIPVSRQVRVNAKRLGRIKKR
jgi:hypothetical protein